MAISKKRAGILYIIQNDKGTIVMGLPQSLRSFAMTQYLALLFLGSLVKGDSAIGGGASSSAFAMTVFFLQNTTKILLILFYFLRFLVYNRKWVYIRKEKTRKKGGKRYDCKSTKLRFIRA